jgi:hypothetical protein
VPGGIAYGAANSEQVVFLDCAAQDSKCAFNFDTGRLSKLSILHGRFLNCNQGIHIKPESGEHLRIENNIITLNKPFWNSVLSRHEDWYWIDADSSPLHRNGNVLGISGRPMPMDYGRTENDIVLP